MTQTTLRTARLLSVALLVGLGIHACSSPTEPLKATTMTLSASGLTLDAIGATSTVTATINDQKGKVMVGVAPTWSSNAATVATVSPTGVISAVGNGTAQITATVETITQTVTVTVQQAPVSPIAVAGNAQTAKVLTALPQALQVKIEDRLGNAISGATVAFTVVTGGGTLSAASATTAAGGLASVQWTLGKTAGSQQSVSATVTGNGGAALFTATGLPDEPTALITAPNVLANGQRVKFGTAVPIRPAVRVVDQHGNGIAGKAVTFTVTAGGGSVTGSSVATDASGIATVGSWTVGSAIGTNTLQASTAGLAPVTFTVESILDPCTADGALAIALGDSLIGSLSDTDCSWTAPVGTDVRNDKFDFYLLTLAAQTSIILEMTKVTGIEDPFLILYRLNGAALDSINANDDIVDGVQRDSRITTTLNPGTYIIRATTWGVGERGSYAIKVRGCAVGIPKTARVKVGNGQVTAPGTAVPVAPQVEVVDECGNGVANRSVAFATVEGVGAITGGSATTNASGVATLGSWTLAAGPNVLSATVAGMPLGAGNPAIFSATGKASTAGFDIALRFVTMPTVSQLNTFATAAARWETIITGDLPTQGLNLAAGTCNSPDALTDPVDDVLIIVRLELIDGPGAVLGSAGPCAARTATNGGLTALGTMRFDTADLANLENAGSFANVILHEMGHVLGIGTLWNSKALLQNASSASNKQDTFFSGTNAVVAFNAVGGNTYTGGQKVPVENCVTGVPTSCGSGTINSHWREAVLRNELMTGYLNSGENPLSALTVASLKDIGYVVDDTKADFFFVQTNLMAGLQSMDQGIHLQDDIEKGPIYTLGNDGRPIGIPASGPTKKRRGR
jgi:hypothetical protein